MRSKLDLKSRVVVVPGAESATALITARSIRQFLRCHIIGVATDLSAAPAHSNVWSELHLTASDLQSYLRFLLELGSKLVGRSSSRPVLIIAQDPIVELVGQNRQQLAEFYDFVMPDAQAVNRLLDKTAFHAWATEQGFPVPASTIVDNLPDLDAALERGPYPLIVKPLVRTAAWDVPFPTLKFFTLAERGARFEHRERLFEYSPRYVVQQWVPGGDDEVYFCLAYFDRAGKPRAWYTGRKILQWPLRTGSTAICVGTVAPEFEAMSLELLARGGLRGLGSVEAKRSPLDGRFYITEPTVGRNDFQSYVATVGGVNLSAYAALDAMALPLPAFDKGKPALWFDELGALRAVRRSGELRQVLRAIGSSGCGLRMGTALFSWRDPMPAWCKLTGELRKVIRRARKRAADSPSTAAMRAEGASAQHGIEVRLWSEQEFLSSRSAWDDLLARSECDPLFLSWPWQSTWWKTFGNANDLELRLFAAYEGQKLMGLAPMFRNVGRQRNVYIRRLQSIGNVWRGPPTMRTEYLDLIVDGACREDVTKALLSSMMAEEWDELVFSDLETSSSLYEALPRVVDHNAIRTPIRYSSYEIRCDRSFETYLAHLSQNARRKLFGQRARLRALGEVQVRYFERNEFDTFARILNELHARRWGKPFFVDEMGEFHREMMDALGDLGEPRLSILYVGEQAVSAMYSWIVAGREYHLQGGFNSRFARSVSLGTLHLGYSIERAFAEKVAVVDLLVGGGRATDFKRHFATPVARSCSVQVVRSKRLRLGYAVLDALRGIRSPTTPAAGAPLSHG